MKKNKITITKKKILYASISLLILISITTIYFSNKSLTGFAINDVDVLFSSGETQYINITFYDSQINDFYFNVSGSEYNSAYPSNITIDIGDDSIIDWQYKVYPSNKSAYAEIVTDAWSNNPGFADIYFRSGMDSGDSGVGLGHIQNNVFQQFANQFNSTLGISNTLENINKQIIAITTNTTTIHAFIPALSGHMIASLYVAEGGSTYYCNSNPSAPFNFGCDLTPEQAMVPANLAREANWFDFNFTEQINNPKIIDTINSQLQGCELPCNITIKITSDTPGNITLSDFQAIGPEPPAIISIQENSTHYNVNINASANLTSVSYFYGNIPNVHVVPIIAGDDSIQLSTNQSTRYSILKNTSAQKWDTLTNSSHPLNFTFYEPKVIENYSIAQNDYSSFSNQARNIILSDINIEHPSIIIILDIKDYFPNRDAFNQRISGDPNGIISEIYFNGFDDSNLKTTLYKYNEELLTNVFIHELAHCFIFFPYKDKLFYSDHPSSFTDLPDFTTYYVNESTLGFEAHNEIYSILNQLRPYVANENIGGIQPQLSTLGKMLLGILSPYDSSNYTLYSGNITKTNNAYIASAMSVASQESASELYLLASDNNWWDIRSNSTIIDVGTSISFAIPKQNQNNRALFISASDLGHPDHFQVFNLNSNSLETIITCIPNLQNTSWTSWANISCLGDDTMNQTRSLIQYDSNDCGEVSNQTFYEYRNTEFCDYCTPNLQNTSWGSWVDISCLGGDTMNQSRFLTQYDSNNCGEITNTTFYQYRATEFCDYCTPSLTNTSWTSWTNVSCLGDDTMNQTRSLIQYDSNDCGEVSNQTFTQYQNILFCDYDSIQPIVTLIFPVNNSVWTTSLSPVFQYNVTDTNTINKCNLYINNVFDQNTTSVTRDISQSFSKSLSNAVYNWKVTCYDQSNNIGNSSTYSLTVSYSAPAPEPEDDGGSSGGSGGGGGGGASPVTTTTPDSTSTTPSSEETPSSPSEDTASSEPSEETDSKRRITGQTFFGEGGTLNLKLLVTALMIIATITLVILVIKHFK